MSGGDDRWPQRRWEKIVVFGLEAFIALALVHVGQDVWHIYSRL